MAVEFGVSLTDLVTGPAKAVSNALSGVALQSKVLQDASSSLEKQMIKSAALGNVAQMQRFTKDQAALTTEIKRLEEAYPGVTQHAATFAQRMKEQAEAAKGASKEHKSFLDEFKEHLVIAISPFEALEKGADFAIEGIKKITESLIEFGAMAIEAVEAKEKLVTAFQALGDGATAGEQTLNMLRELEKEVPQSEKQLGEWAKTLMGAGVTDLGPLRDSMKAVASSEALITGGGEKTLNLLAKLNEAGEKGSKFKFTTKQLVGVGVTEKELMAKLGMTPATFELAKKNGELTGRALADAVTNILQEKGAGPLAVATNVLGAQWVKLTDNVKKLFEGVDFKPFLDAVKSLFGLFDQGSDSAMAMKGTLTLVLNGVFAGLAQLIPIVRTMFLEMIILGLEAYVTVWKPLANHMDLVVAIAGGMLVAMVTLGAAAVVALWPLVTVVWSLAAGVLAATWPVLAIGLGIAVVVGLIIYFRKEIGNLLDALDQWVDKGAKIAGNFIDGLVNGIANGAAKVWNAIVDLGDTMVKGLAHAIGAHSPSIKMMKIGGFASEGFAKGITAGNDNVQEAASGMGASAMDGASGTGGGSSGGVTIGSITITIEGGSGKTDSELTEAAVTSIFERIALEQGLGAVA